VDSRLETEPADHPTTARVRHLDFQAHLAQELLLRGHAQDRLLVAVAVQQRSAAQPRWVVAVLQQKLAQQKGLFAESLSIRVVGQEPKQLIAEDRGAARFEHDDRHTGSDLRAQCPEDLAQMALGKAQHPVVVERAPAADGR
jgi:hypothetical protein